MSVGEGMSLEFTYQQRSCVLLTGEYVPGIVTDPTLVAAVDSSRTQLLEMPEVEVAGYGTLQIVNSEQPPGHPANVSLTETGDEPLSRLTRAARSAFTLALAKQSAVAVGVNFAATIELSEQAMDALLSKLFSPRIVGHSTDPERKLMGGGIRLIYDMNPWIATVAIERDPKQKTQMACAANFNIDKPKKNQVALIRDAEKLRGWFEKTVNGIVGGAPDG